MPHVHGKSCSRVTGLLFICFSLIVLHSPLFADDVSTPLAKPAEKSPATDVAQEAPQADQASPATPAKRYQVTLYTTAMPLPRFVVETQYVNNAQNQVPTFTPVSPPKDAPPFNPFGGPLSPQPFTHAAQPPKEKAVSKDVKIAYIPQSQPIPNTPHQPLAVILTCDSVTLETDSTQEELQYKIQCNGNITLQLYGSGDTVKGTADRFEYSNGVANLSAATLTAPTYQLKTESLQLNFPVVQVAVTKEIPANNLPQGPAPNPAANLSPYAPAQQTLPRYEILPELKSKKP